MNNVVKSTDINKWVHVMVTYADGANNIKFYRNGELAGSTTSTLTGAIGNSTHPVTIGRGKGGTNSDYLFPGSIDEPRIYNRALTPQEIEYNYLMGKGQHKN